ncbi:pogo transposable element with KRAB domain-like protein [Aphelenchoides avenae]|nr:pogo transposable element with KRAB domain-like protein [Aphelenchus avenae]
MQLCNHWMMHGEHEATAPGVYLEWVLEAWNDGVTKYNIVNSFKTCGITTALDGSKDYLIHCLKDDNGMPTGATCSHRSVRMVTRQTLLSLWPASSWTSMETTSVTSVMLKSWTIRVKKGTINAESDCSDDSEF